MSRRNLLVSLGAVAGLVLFFYLLVHLLLLRYAKGDVYPPSSTLRPDPLGTRAFYEALPDAGKYDVARGYVSLRRELALKPATVLVLGVDAFELSEFTPEEIDELNDYVQKGGRVVMTLNPMNAGGDSDDDTADKEKEKEKEKKKPDAKKASAKDEKDKEADKEAPLAIPIPEPAGKPKTEQEKHEREEYKKEQEFEERQDPDRFIPGKFQPSIQAVWGFSWTYPGEKTKNSKDDNKDSKGPSAEPAAASGSSAEYAHGDVLAESTGAVGTEDRVPWKSPLSFIRVDPAWQVAYTAKGKPVVIARKWGQGDVIVATDSYFVSNEALRDDRKPLLLAWIAGPSGLLLFDETHLGVQEKEGVMVLARRYRLEGYLYGLLFVTGLFLWRQSVPLVPPTNARAQAAGGVVSGKDSRSGLVNLLRRNIAPRDLLATCLAEWRRHASRGTPAVRTAEMERLAAQNAAPEHLIETYRQLSRVNTGEQKENTYANQP